MRKPIILQKFVDKLQKNKNKLKKSDDFLVIKKFVFYVLFFGILINFTLYSVFNLSFTALSWIGYGILLWLIENKFRMFLRSLWFR